ncbi:MAG TPA: choice-of-anchor tandem repeat GloVer-containing protein [Rhizomicrobium sp.]|nr:choice-of-anchor tandem repeat GloVer-containing protein [Rhizomicrobium sp.]
MLHPFTGGSDGNTPEAGVIADGKGNLYGTTNNGGTYGYGTVFELAPDGTETVLYSFTGGSDGAFPAAGLLRIAGNLYSVTSNGGARGAGTVFESRRGKRAPGPKGSCTLSPAAPTAAIPTPT